MRFEILSEKTTGLNRQAADLISRAFACYADCADEEIAECLESDKIALAALADDTVIGFAGAVARYRLYGMGASSSCSSGLLKV